MNPHPSELFAIGKNLQTDEYTVETRVKYCCATVLLSDLSVSRNVYIWLESIAKDAMSARFRVRATKPAVAISVQISFWHIAAGARNTWLGLFTL